MSHYDVDEFRRLTGLQDLLEAKKETLSFKETGDKGGGTGFPTHTAKASHGHYGIFKRAPSKFHSSHLVHYAPHNARRGDPESYHIGDANSPEEGMKVAAEHHKKQIR